MDKILHDPKDPKLWELWYIPYYGSCRILSINSSIGNYLGPYGMMRLWGLGGFRLLGASGFYGLQTEPRVRFLKGFRV